MEFTGERFVSNLNSAQIAYEHWHRYLYAAQFVAGKKVLDIACGEGYGADFLANTAEEVFGVDVSLAAISFAQEKYKKKNLHFLKGSVENIPIEGTGVFDVITSFETIEHVDEKSQEKFLSEVLRLLKPDGVFIVSTPNKKIYSDIPHHQNEFHIKEFYREEFEMFLKKYFLHISFLGQKVLGGSYIWPFFTDENSFLEAGISFGGEFHFPKKDFIEEVYIIAVCSHSNLLNIPFSFQVDYQNRYILERDESIVFLKDMIFSYEKKFEDYKNYLADKDQTIKNIYSSFSWRITSPIRSFFDFFIKKKK